MLQRSPARNSYSSPSGPELPQIDFAHVLYLGDHWDYFPLRAAIDAAKSSWFVLDWAPPHQIRAKLENSADYEVFVVSESVICKNGIANDVFESLRARPVVVINDTGFRGDSAVSRLVNAVECLDRSQLTADGVARALRYAQRTHRLQSEIVEVRDRDPLTGLFTEKRMRYELRRAIDRAARLDGRVALFSVGVDKLREVSHYHHRTAREFALVKVAERLTQSMRSVDTVARVGKDQFVVLAESLAQGAEAVVADKLLKTISETMTWNRTSISLSASVGVALNVRDNHEPRRMLHESRAAMYYAQLTGGQRWESYAPLRSDTMWIVALKRARAQASAVKH